MPLVEIHAAANRTLRRTYVLDGQVSLEVVLKLSGALPAARLAIIGGGFMAAAAGRFLAKRYTELGLLPDVTIFEQELTAGEGIGALTVGGVTVELTGEATALNRYTHLHDFRSLTWAALSQDSFGGHEARRA